MQSYIIQETFPHNGQTHCFKHGLYKKKYGRRRRKKEENKRLKHGLYKKSCTLWSDISFGLNSPCDGDKTKFEIKMMKHLTISFILVLSQEHSDLLLLSCALFLLLLLPGKSCTRSYYWSVASLFFFFGSLVFQCKSCISLPNYQIELNLN